MRKKGHFAKMCRTRKFVNQIQNVTDRDTDNDDEPNVGYVFTLSDSLTSSQFNIKVQSKPISILVDSGASVNILDEKTFKSLNVNRSKLKSTNTQIFTYGSRTPPQLLGAIELPTEVNQPIKVVKYHIAAG